MGTKINLRRDQIDWRKEDVALLTVSGILHHRVPKDELSKHYIIASQGWYNQFYTVNIIKPTDSIDYISIKSYHACKTYRVGDFKETNGKNIASFNFHDYWYTNESDNKCTQNDVDCELRIYPDGKAVVLHEILNPNEDGKNQQLYFIYLDQEGIMRFHTYFGTNQASNLKSLEYLKRSGKIIELKSEQDVFNNRKNVTNKLASWIINDFIYCGDFVDEEHRQTQFKNAYDRYGWSQQLSEDIKTFFRWNDRNHTIKDKFEKEYHNSSIDNISRLMSFCKLINTTTQATNETKQDKANQLASYIPEWSNGDEPENKNKIFWTRHDDDIICFYNADRHGSRIKRLFSYNVKTKTRLYGELYNMTWSFPIPGLGYILDNIWPGSSGGRPNIAENRPEIVIKNNLSVRQLFDGTNIAWILDNASDLLVEAEGEYGQSWSDQQPVSLQDHINEKRISSLAIAILSTTGVKVLEQLLKAKLFNMYFYMLTELMFKTGNRDSYDFYDLDKKRSYESDYDKKGAAFLYSGKKNNLKEMFNLPISVLRIIDKTMIIASRPAQKYEYQTRSYVQYTQYKRQVPTLNGINRVLGVDMDAIKKLDPETIELALKTSLRAPSRYYSSTYWDTVGTELIQNFPNTSPKQIIKYLSEIGGDIQEYKDYLRMRLQMKQMQEVRPDINIFTESKYPIKPTTGKKFIPYLEGITNRFQMWRHEIFTTRTFIESYKKRYQSLVDSGDFEVIYDKNDPTELLGIALKLDTASMLKYLHDELSYWVTFYQDSTKNALFVKAIDRVKDLEYIDEETGLCIIAPDGINDMKKEGTTLSHCVASYTDAIIDGKENIMFIRRIDMPQDPFFTLEILNDGKIRQVHCYRNGDLTEEGQKAAYINSQMPVYNKVFDIVKFLQNWCKANKGKVDKQTIVPRYGALCHI